MPVSRRVLVAVTLLVLLVACGSEGGGPSVRPAGPGQSAGERPVVRALEVLRRWDRHRASAYAAGDPAALRRLYAPGSWAGARDVRILREYADRGLVVRGLRMQVLEAQLLPAGSGVLRLRVVERLAGATVVGVGSQVALPPGRTRSRVLTFDDVGRRWVLRSVRRGALSGAPRPAGR